MKLKTLIFDKKTYFVNYQKGLKRRVISLLEALKYGFS